LELEAMGSSITLGASCQIRARSPIAGLPVVPLAVLRGDQVAVDSEGD
jgi:hypothetical protein